jgi:tetratricopeptide (TPR) repeat protein
MEEKEHVISILEQTKKALVNEENIKLKELSNQTIHTASIEQNPESITLAVLVYSLSKFIERKEYYESKEKNFKSFLNKISRCLDKALINLKNGNFKEFSKNLKKAIDCIKPLQKDFKKQIEYVFNRSRINKASRIYEHGISIEKTSHLLGITQFELADYAGKTGISNVDLSITKSERERIKDLTLFFKD